MNHMYEINNIDNELPIKIYNHTYNTNFNMQPHLHDEIELIYIEKGKLNCIVDGKTTTYNQDDIIVINSKSIHYLTFLLDNTTLITLLLSNRLIKKYDFREYLFDETQINKLKNEILPLIFFLKNKRKSNDGLSIFKRHTKMYELYEILLFKCSIVNKETEKSQIQNIIEYIDINYNKEISLNKLSSKFGFSYVYLSRMFKEKTGMNITQYLNNIRINHAYVDILNTDDSMLTISYRHGFRNINAFYREFKKHYNESPLKIRKLNNSMK